MKDHMKTKLRKLVQRLDENDQLRANVLFLEAMLSKPLLSNEEVACLFRVTVRTVYNWRNRKKHGLKCVPVQSRIYFTWSDLIDFLEGLDGLDNTH